MVDASLVTVVCAATNTGIMMSATYGGMPLSTVIKNQQQNLYVGMFYGSNPPPGPQQVAVTLNAASGTTVVECSVTTWTGGAVIDTSIASTSYEFGSTQMSVSIAPKATVPSNEIFFSALGKFEWGSGTALSVQGSGATASVVDSNLNHGPGSGDGCMFVPGSSDYDCIASARLLPGGTSLAYSWTTYGAYAVVAGFGIKNVVTGWPGWAGSHAVYLSTGLTTAMSLFSPGTVWYNVSQPSSSAPYNLGNAIGLSVGGSDFYEYYVPAPNGPYMDILVPVAAASGSQEIVGGYDDGEPVYQYASLGVASGIASTAWGENILTGNNSGVNVTGSYNKGTFDNPPLWSLGDEAAGFLPIVGYSTGGFNMIMDIYEALKGTVGPDTYTAGGSSGNQYVQNIWGVVNNQNCGNLGCSATNVFISQMMVEAKIYTGDWGNDPFFIVSGHNRLQSVSDFQVGADGASASMNIDMYEAVTLTGKVTSAGTPVAGATVHIEPTSGMFAGTDYQVLTSASGGYEYLAQVGIPYNVWAVAPVGQGGASSTVFSVSGASPGAISQDIPFSVVSGTVYAAGTTDASNTVSFWDGSILSSVVTDANGHYSFWAKPSTSYTETVTYGTTFGNAQWQQTYTTPASSAITENVVLPVSYVTGTVSASGVAVANAKVTVTSPSGYQTYVCTNSVGGYFFYTNGAGTYTYNSIGSYYYAQAGPYSYNFGTNARYSGYNFALGSGSSTGCGSPPGGGGGGCLLSGALIALPDGDTKAINGLHVGNAVLGFNATTGVWVAETVTSITSSFVSEVLSIDNGLLVTTLTDQPLWVRNGTWTGWIHNPQDLIPGEQLFMPSTGAWVTVTNLQILTGSFRVYDLRVTAPNDFVANGVLVGDKPKPI